MTRLIDEYTVDKQMKIGTDGLISGDWTDLWMSRFWLVAM
jgi:hypothetical protein